MGNKNITFLDEMELERLHKITKLRQVTTIKRQLIKLGFTHQLAMYGVLENTETKEAHYKRIDVLIDTPITHEIFTRLYEFMNFIKNPAKYSIWAYSDETKQVKEVKFFE